MTDITTDFTTPTHPWTPDQRDGTYRNPILCADYSDPDAIRDGDDFYLTASSFNCTPGLPILHSRDLVNWTIINHAVKNLPHPRYAQPQHGQGIWAPAIRKHDARFWIFFPTPDEGIYLTTADHPAGRWSEPHLVQPGRGLIDPCPLWDEDGNAYLVYAWAHSRSGIKHRLDVRPMAPDGSKLLGEGKVVFNAPDRHPTLEGPKFHKRNGWYYISAPAGGVATGWQLILRSRNVYGPYEEKIVLEQGRTPINGPHQGAIVELESGESWFIHFQDADPYGRIVHLQPVRWEDDWPLMGVDHDGNGVGEPVGRFRKPGINYDHPIAIPQTSDMFDGPPLGLQWQWHANHQDDWHSLTARPGFLRLRAVPTENDFTKAPNLLLQKFPARIFSADTELELNASDESSQAGLIVMGKQHAALTLQHMGDTPRLLLIVNNQIIEDHPVESSKLRLRVNVANGGLCTFHYAERDDFKSLGAPFQATEGAWIGAKIGLFCRSLSTSAMQGHADFSYFNFSSPGPKL